MTQDGEETMTQYVTRLRKQAKNCNFEDEDTEIYGQIIEKCSSTKLRQRLLEKSDVKLNEIMEIAKTMEAVSLQVKEMEGRAVARVMEKKKYTKKGMPKTVDGVECFRCGYKGHKCRDDKCPAKEKTCNKNRTFCKRVQDQDGDDKQLR